MPVGHLKYSPTTSTHGKFVQSMLSSLKDGKRKLADLIGVLNLMIDGDGTQDTHYTYMRIALGCDTDAGARAIWDELNSANSKISTDASVTNVNAALEQLFNKLTV